MFLTKLLITLPCLFNAAFGQLGSLVPGTLTFCEYYRLRGIPNPPGVNCPTTVGPVFLPLCASNAPLTQCTTDAASCPQSGTVCTQTNNQRCCQGSNPGLPVSDINAKAGSCPRPSGVNEKQDVTIGCWLDNNCPGIQKCCVEPNPVTNSASRFCRDPIGVTGLAICAEPLAIGSCSRTTARYYYDSGTQQCRNFQYSGCGGNGNNFGSLAACQSVCGGIGISGTSACPADANVGLNCQFPRPNACNTDADCVGRLNTLTIIQPTCCLTTCGHKICYEN